MIENKDEEKFKAFDYGENDNKEKYGTVAPPEYDLSKIHIPVFMYHGQNDLLSTFYNVLILKKKMQNAKIRKLKGYGHLTFFWGLSLEDITK